MLRSVWVVAGIVLIAAAPSSAAGKRHKPAARPSHAPLGVQIQEILNDPANGGAEWGVSVTTLEGAPLYQHNDEQRFAAASNTKLVTTAAALALLGPQFTTTTRVLAPPGFTAGTVRGDLTLVGAGDTSMSARVLPYALRTLRGGDPLTAFDDLAAQIARAGIREVTGNIVGDDTYFAHQPWASGWEWNDLQWEYGAPVSALMANDNVQYLSIAPGDLAGAPALYSWLPQIAHFTIESTVRTVAQAPGVKADIGASRLPNSRVVRLWGTIPAGAKPVDMALAVDDPAVYAAEALKERLEAHGVRVDGAAVAKHKESSEAAVSDGPVSDGPVGVNPVSDTPVGGGAVGTRQAGLNSSSSVTNSGVVVASRISPPLLQDITVINKVSQNLHAEVALLQLTASTGGTRSDALAAERRFLLSAGLQGRDFLLRDGSGLSRDDMITPRALTALLRYAALQPWGADWKASLPVGGVDGSLAERFTRPPLMGQVFAKTGTLEQDAALSGYVTAASGRTIVFSILCNRHWPGGAARADIDRMVAAIAAVD
jgi:D-alanyl-D-alanine carboxypeptidase/D-alanyl-D-alanine-endopeptidase (penicillin-binding protein 4)